MTLKAMVATLDGMDESVSGLYKQDGERFILDVEAVEGFSLENVAGLKSALASERTAKDEAVKLTKAFEDLDPTLAREALAKVEDMKTWSSDDKVAEQIEAKTKEVASSKDAEIDALNVKLGFATSSLETATVNKALIDAATKAGFVSPSLAPKLFRDGVKLLEKDGKYTAIVVNNTGEQRTQVLQNGDIKPFTIEEYVAEQAALDEYKPLIKGNPASGTGNPPAANPLNPNADTQISRGENEGQALNNLSKLI